MCHEEVGTLNTGTGTLQGTSGAVRVIPVLVFVQKSYYRKISELGCFTTAPWKHEPSYSADHFEVTIPHEGELDGLVSSKGPQP